VRVVRHSERHRSGGNGIVEGDRLQRARWAELDAIICGNAGRQGEDNCPRDS
jgi:hypothetical protein